MTRKVRRRADCARNYAGWEQWTLIPGRFTSTAAAVNSSRASFDTKATAIRWTCTTGLRFALQFWHAKTPVFTYPRGWFPWYIEWLLGFPRCPYGGVSVNVWSAACGTVIALMSHLIIYLVQYMVQLRGEGAQAQKVKAKQKVGMEGKKQ
jgi:tail-anchored protein insertion receptor